MIIDGVRIEDRSIPLIKMEVDVATAANLNNLETSLTNYINSEISNLGTSIHNEISNLGTSIDGNFVHRTNNISENITGEKTFTSDAIFKGITTFESTVQMDMNLTVSGNLNVTGTVTNVHSQDMSVSDNEIILNANEPGPGITAGMSGFKFYRGPSPSLAYVLRVHEIPMQDPLLRGGLEGNEKTVAFVEDIPSIIQPIVGNLLGDAYGDVTGPIPGSLTVAKIKGVEVSHPVGSVPSDNRILMTNAGKFDLVDPAGRLNADKLDGYHASDIIAMMSGGSNGDVIIVGAGVIACSDESDPNASTWTFPGNNSNKIVVFSPAATDTNYTVNINAIDNAANAYIGDVFTIPLTTTSFSIRNTGSHTGRFKWSVVAKGEQYAPGHTVNNSGVNADMVDGFHAGTLTGQVAVSNNTKCETLNADMIDGYHAGNENGKIPINNGTLSTNLNADMLDGKHLSDVISDTLAQVPAVPDLIGDVTGPIEGNTVTKLRGTTIKDVPPEDGKALVYSSAESAYVPGEVGGAAEGAIVAIGDWSASTSNSTCSVTITNAAIQIGDVVVTIGGGPADWQTGSGVWGGSHATAVADGTITVALAVQNESSISLSASGTYLVIRGV